MVKNNILQNRSSQNPTKYVWIIIGYYLFSALLKVGASTGKQNISYVNVNKLVGDVISDSHPPNSSGFHIFKVEWHNIEGIAVMALWICFAALAKIAFHAPPKLAQIFPESGLQVIVGLVCGVFIYTTKAIDSKSVELNPNIFFFFMLLDAGYFMPSRLFFGNIGTILLFGVIGTVWNTFTIGLSLWCLGLTNLFGVQIGLLEHLLFSTLISAIDPVAVLTVFDEIQVNNILYIFVFGEMLLNDAISIVLYNIIEKYSVMGEEGVTETEIGKGVASFIVAGLGGTFIGIIWGFMTGFATKYTHHAMVIEPVVIYVMACLSYLNAELFGMSGVLTIAFCGITMKQYVESNISPNSRITVKFSLRLLSSSAETIMFIFLGVSAVNDDHIWNWWYIIMTIVFCNIHRLLGILWMSALANKFRLNKLNMVDQFVLGYGGLRGAVAFSLVILIPKAAAGDNDETRRMFETTTIAVVLFTVFVQGITIKPFVKWLNVGRAEKREINMNERLHERLMDHTLCVVEMIVGIKGENVLREKIMQLNETYIRPYLIRMYKGTSETKILETYSKLEMGAVMDGIKKRQGVPIQVACDPAPEREAHSSIEERIDKPASLRKKSFTCSQSNTSMKDGALDLLFDNIFKPVHEQRRHSYSRQRLEPGDLETDLSGKTRTPVQGQPRRKLGVSHLGGHADSFKRVKLTLTILNEISRDDRNSTPTSGVSSSHSADRHIHPKVNMADTD